MANPIKRAWNSKATGLTAGAVLVPVLLAVIVAFVLSFTAPVKPGATAPQQTETPQPSPAAASAQPTPDAAACNVPAGDTSLRPKLPTDLRWEAAQGLTWPVSASVGPTTSKDGYPACFARSPLGAALFGTNFVYQSWVGDFHSVTDFYTIDSPGKTALAKLSQQDTPQEVAQAGWTAAGFIVDAFTPNEAQVTIVFSTPGSQTGYTGFPLTLDWVDGDWRVKVLDSGSYWAGSPSTPVKGQFVEWRQ